MQQKITLDRQIVVMCLKQRQYYIDFYQRESVWVKVTVERLLDDIWNNINAPRVRFGRSITVIHGRSSDDSGVGISSFARVGRNISHRWMRWERCSCDKNIICND